MIFIKILACALASYIAESSHVLQRAITSPIYPADQNLTVENQAEWSGEQGNERLRGQGQQCLIEILAFKSRLITTCRVDCAETKFSPQRSYWLGCLALLALNGAVFWPVLHFDFVRWDDDISVGQNPLLTMPWSGALVEQLLGGDQALRFKPLHWICFRLLHEAGGFQPIAWHVFNLVLHITATILFYLILRRLFHQRSAQREKSHGEWAALAGAAVWAVHPLRAEVVAWVTASTYSLTAVSLLASFACYLEARLRPGRARRWLMLSWVLAVAAYASYPVGLTYGLWLIAVESWLRPDGLEKAGGARVRLSAAWCTQHAFFLAPAALAMVPTLWSRFMTPGIFMVAPTFESVGLLSRLTMALASLTCSVWRLFWPVDLTPNVSPFVVRSAPLGQIWFFALLAAIGLALAWRARWRHPAWALVGFGFAALALPCLGWTEKPVWQVDRYSYLVHMVLVGGLAGWLFHRVGASRTRLIFFGCAAAIIVIACAFSARRQAMIWQDSTALFTHMKRHPHFADNPRQQGHIYILWANYEASAGRPARAVELFNSAQQVYFLAIRAAVARFDYAEAWSLSTHLQQYFTLTPIMQRERGAWLLRLSRVPEAFVELHAAASAMPGDPRLRSLLAEAHAGRWLEFKLNLSKP